MNLYSIRRWNELYENSRSREVESLSWVKVPNKHDGENYTAMITHPDGSVIFSAWILLIQIASKCNPRGTLIRENGLPHTPLTLSLKTRAPQEWFQTSLDYLLNHTDWIDAKDVTGNNQSTADDLPLNCRSTADDLPKEEKGMEQNRKERRKSGNGFSEQIPEALNTPEFLAAWLKWEQHRKEIRKKLTPTAVDQQFAELLKIGPVAATRAIEHSIGNGYTGIFEPKASRKQSGSSPRCF